MSLNFQLGCRHDWVRMAHKCAYMYIHSAGLTYHKGNAICTVDLHGYTSVINGKVLSTVGKFARLWGHLWNTFKDRNVYLHDKIYENFKSNWNFSYQISLCFLIQGNDKHLFNEKEKDTN